MPKTIQHKVSFRASPETLFNIYLSSRKHAAATGAKAAMSRKVGGRFWPMLVTSAGGISQSCRSS